MYEFLDWKKNCLTFQQMRKRKSISECDENIFNLLSDGVYIEKDNKIIYSNSSASKILTGSEDNLIIGCQLKDLIVIDDEYKGMYKQALERRKNNDIGDFLYLKATRIIDHSEIDVEYRCKNIIYKSEQVFMVVIKDVSSIIQAEMYQKECEKSSKLLQQTMEYDRMKTEFNENLTHELRTPLNVILGVAQLQDVLLKKDDLSKDAGNLIKYNNVLKQNCYRLMRMVNNLLDITKIEAGYLDLSLKNENIVAVVEEIALSVVEYAQSRNIDLVFDTDIEEKFMAFDADYVERIVMNLLSNAVKFSPAGGTIYVNVKDLNDKVKISVKDEGEGISLEKQKKLFNRFCQVDKNYIRKNKGTGIGLSLVKSLVELHDGKIELNSAPGKGSEFSVILPAKTVKQPECEVEDNCIRQSRVERVSIEFSDIYNIDMMSKTS